MSMYGNPKGKFEDLADSYSETMLAFNTKEVYITAVEFDDVIELMCKVFEATKEACLGSNSDCMLVNKQVISDIKIEDLKL